MADDLRVENDKEDRYSRLRLMPWWDQERLARARIMVVGAGALGNEIIKNLALLGAGELLIVDFDTVEESNLSRSILFGPEDGGRPKAEAAADAAARINADCRAYALNGDVGADAGLGLFRWADAVVCGLDNREARLAVNRACWKMNTPWVDGATESMRGVARVFVPPDGPCYECTLGDRDLKIMAARDSCGFLAKEAYRQGRTPTTPTASSVIAAVQVQEALKLLHPDSGLPTLSGKGFFFDGHAYDCFTIDYVRREDCVSHETFSNIVQTDLTSCGATLADVASEAAKRIGPDVTIEFPCEMITALRCPRCNTSEPFFRLARSTNAGDARCASCGEVRVPEAAYEYSSRAPEQGKRPAEYAEMGSRTLAELGFGIMDVIPARGKAGEVQIEISGDLERVFREVRQ